MDRYTSQRNLREQMMHVYRAIRDKDSYSVPPLGIHPPRWNAMIKSAIEDLTNIENKVYDTSQITRS